MAERETGKGGSILDIICNCISVLLALSISDPILKANLDY